MNAHMTGLNPPHCQAIFGKLFAKRRETVCFYLGLGLAAGIASMRDILSCHLLLLVTLLGEGHGPAATAKEPLSPQCFPELYRPWLNVGVPLLPLYLTQQTL